MSYPIWWDKELTLYNRYEDPQTQLIKWYRTELQNCFWKASGSVAVVNDVTLDTAGIICRIPKNDKFLEKYEWVELPNDEMEEYFTLGTGDIIVKGIVKDEIDEYTRGKHSTDLLAKYNGLRECMEIKELAINTGAGRNEEHYWVRGT